MRSKLLLLAAVALVGCSEDEPQSPAVVADAAPETIGIDVVTDSSAPVDSAVTDTGVVDSSTDVADTTTTDTRPETTADTSLDTLETAVDTAVDTSLDTAVEVATDTALDAVDTAVGDASFGAAPTCDGTVATGEYASQTTHTGTSNTWHVTWDDTAIYIAIANANPAEGAVIYIDANPVAPPSGGTNADGNLAGYEYDSTKLATLPFRANLVAYAKSGYREYRTSDGAGGWSATPTTAFGCFASSGTTRELSIPWSALGGRPTAFGFLGYVTSGGGFVYGEVPMANPDGSIGTSATATKYFHVGSTGPTSTASAFADER